MYAFKEEALKKLREIRQAGRYKEERVIDSPQGPRVKVSSGGEVLNFCANNYLGLSNHPGLIEAAKLALDKRGFGLSSVRFICGTQDIHKDLEKRIASFLGTDDAILYSSCFDANGGLFEAILVEGDAIFSDELNHASIIDGIELAKARRKVDCHVYRHGDMADLEQKLNEARGARWKMIATDGIFSMDGDEAPLASICEIAKRHQAMVMVDDSHATGFVGKTGRGTPERCGVEDQIDLLTSTFGKALGGASGGFTTGRRELIELLRQKSRPYMFSNTLPPPLVAAGLNAFDILEQAAELRTRLMENASYFRQGITQAGFDIKTGWHPIVPIMLRDAKLAQAMARELFDEGILVIAVLPPAVAVGGERIRVQISAAHERDQLNCAIDAFRLVGQRHGVVK